MASRIFVSRNVLTELLANSLQEETFNDIFPQLTDDDTTDDVDDTITMDKLSEMYADELSYEYQAKIFDETLAANLFATHVDHPGFNQIKLWLVTHQASTVKGDYGHAYANAKHALSIQEPDLDADAVITEGSEDFVRQLVDHGFKIQEATTVKIIRESIKLALLTAPYAGSKDFSLANYFTLITPYRELKLSQSN